MQWEQGAAQGQIDKTMPGMTDANGQPIGLAIPPVVPVHDYDNHAVHIEVHNRFRKSQAFENLSTAVQAEFQKHVSMHENALQAKLAEQMQMQMQAQGAPQGAPQGEPTAPPPAQ